MKRDARLRVLSEDHHHALVLARRARRGGLGLQAPAAGEVWAEMARRFAEALEPHFQIEERLLLPALEALGEDELVAQTRAEHARLRQIVYADSRPVEERLAAFGALLGEHVRFEEHSLFEVAQARLPAADLDAIARACAATRTDGGGGTEDDPQ